LTDVASPFHYRVIACPWDDRATQQGAPDPGCSSFERTASASPARLALPLPLPGSYGIRVETFEEDEVTSISRLRAVRNGSSVRLGDVAVVDGWRVRSIVLPSADGITYDTGYALALSVIGLNGTLHDMVQPIAFPPVGDDERSLLGMTSLPGAEPAWYSIRAEVRGPAGVTDAYALTVDACMQHGLCCRPSTTRAQLLMTETI
jgi:hypothetical protein